MKASRTHNLGNKEVKSNTSSRFGKRKRGRNTMSLRGTLIQQLQVRRTAKPARVGKMHKII